MHPAAIRPPLLICTGLVPAQCAHLPLLHYTSEYRIFRWRNRRTHKDSPCRLVAFLISFSRSPPPAPPPSAPFPKIVIGVAAYIHMGGKCTRCTHHARARTHEERDEGDFSNSGGGARAFRSRRSQLSFYRASFSYTFFTREIRAIESGIFSAIRQRGGPSHTGVTAKGKCPVKIPKKKETKRTKRIEEILAYLRKSSAQKSISQGRFSQIFGTNRGQKGNPSEFRSFGENRFPLRRTRGVRNASRRILPFYYIDRSV